METGLLTDWNYIDFINMSYRIDTLYLILNQILIFTVQMDAKASGKVTNKWFISRFVIIGVSLVHTGTKILSSWLGQIILEYLSTLYNKSKQ